MISRNGVCYDLTISPYKTERNGLVYYFSSQAHKDKFEKRLKKNRETINTSLSNRFNICIDVSTLADVVLYKKVETRGFLIEVKEDNKQCPEKLAESVAHLVATQVTMLEQVKYVGGNVTLKRSSAR